MWAKTEMRCWRQVWNLEGMQAGSPPPLLRSLKPFAGNQRMPEAEITCIAVHAASWPRLTIAVGLATSQIYVLRGGSGTAEHLSLMCSLPSPGAMPEGLAPPKLKKKRTQAAQRHPQPPASMELHACEAHGMHQDASHAVRHI